MNGDTGRGFGETISICFGKYADFSGRAPRSEFWWWVLFVFLVGLAAGLVAGVLDLVIGNRFFQHLANLVLFLAFIVPDIAVAVRRMHDIDRSGWWLLIGFVPFIGWIVLLVFYCLPGTSGANRFGPSPLRTF